MCILNDYLVFYSDVFGRECYTEVEAFCGEEAIETVQEQFSDGLYVPYIISVEEVERWNK